MGGLSGVLSRLWSGSGQRAAGRLVGRFPGEGAGLSAGEGAAGFVGSVPLDRAVRRRAVLLAWRVRRVQTAAAGRVRARAEAVRFAARPRPVPPAGPVSGPAGVSAVLERLSLVAWWVLPTLTVAVVVADFAFFFDLYRDLGDARSWWSLPTLMAAGLALVTPLLVLVVARPFGVAVSAALHGRASRTKSVGAVLLGVLLVATVVLFAEAGSHRFAEQSAKPGAAPAPVGLLTAVFALLPVLVAVAHAVAESPQLREERHYRRAERRDRPAVWWRLRALRRADVRLLKAHTALRGLVDGVLSTHGDVPAMLLEHMILAGRAAAGKPAPALLDNLDLAQVSDTVRLQATAAALPRLPLRRLLVALRTLHEVTAPTFTDTTHQQYLALLGRPDTTADPGGTADRDTGGGNLAPVPAQDDDQPDQQQVAA